MIRSGRFKYFGIGGVLAALALLSGCTAVGAAAGGYIGHETTHSTVGTVGGAVAGGIVGYELGK